MSHWLELYIATVVFCMSTYKQISFEVLHVESEGIKQILIHQ
jgi:hypothetical protein